MIDLRSDTVTRPTDAMRKAIYEAAVGDDVYHDDPTVLELEEVVAGLLGKEDAMFTPTGTMANQTALKVHTSPGDVVLASQSAHIDDHELGAANMINGLTVRQLPGSGGVFTSDDVRRALPEVPSSMPSSLFQPVTLLAVENTHNAAGGAVWPIENILEVTQAAHSLRIATHLDGARLWNATAASGVSEKEYSAGFDTVSVCFSKGLGAPMGSALAGPSEMITTARRFKQMFGGGFRQAGMMAAGALYAVKNHRSRLGVDHGNAIRLGQGLGEISEFEVDLENVQSNMVYFRLTSIPAQKFAEQWLALGVAALPMSDDTIRVVTHLEISPEDVDRAIRTAEQVVNGRL